MGNMIWRFSPAARAALERAGVSTPAARQSLVLKLLATDLRAEDEAQIDFFGIPLRVQPGQRGYLIVTEEE